jgi:rare lipoprotein A
VSSTPNPAGPRRHSIRTAPSRPARTARVEVPAAKRPPLRAAAAALAVVALLAGCASGPPRGGAAADAPPAGGTRPAASARSPDRDGPGADPPPGLAAVPDAEPIAEPFRRGGPNKPYEALGQTYVPITEDRPLAERGLASWYGAKFHGRRTASGERYDMYAMTAAHPTLPIPSYARVRNPANGREVVVRINDRGPFHSSRIVDLSYTAALKLGLLRGVATVELERITGEQIRTGSWRRGAGDGTVARGATTPPGAAIAQVEAGSSVAPATSTQALQAMPAMQSMQATTSMPPTPALTSPASTRTEPLPLSTAAASAPTSAATTIDALPPLPSASAVPPAADLAGVAGGGSVAGFWVQLGAFRARDGAENLRRQVAGELAWLAPLLLVIAEAPLYRLQAGPYADRGEARGVAARVRDALRLVPAVVERR